MDEYMEALRAYLGTRRDFTKKIFKFTSMVYRAVIKKRITWEQCTKEINRLGGRLNEWKVV